MMFQFQVTDVESVIAYKRDEITTDLICLDVSLESDGCIKTWTFHEDQPEFDTIVERLEKLPGFLQDWRAQVVVPPFVTCRTVLYTRKAAPDVA